MAVLRIELVLSNFGQISVDGWGLFGFWPLKSEIHLCEVSVSLTAALQ